MKRNFSFTFAVILTLSLMSTLITRNVGAQVSPAPQQKDKAVAGGQGGDREREAARARDTKPARKSTRNRKAGPADASVENDGDLPDLMKGKVNRKEYLRNRAEHIARLRGQPDAAKFKDSPRLKALDEMAQQEASLRKAAREGRVRPLISNTSWTPIGPAPLPNGQTDTVTAPVNGRVTCVAIHPTNIDIVYVGTALSGVYRTLNGGQTWTPILDSALTLAIGSIAIDPATPSTIFVGTGEGNLSLDSFEGVGVYRVKNADSATPVIEGPFETRTNGGNGHAFIGTAINKIIIDPNNNNNMFVGNTLAGSGMNGEGTCCGATNPASAFIGLYFSANAQAATPTWVRVGSLPGGGFGGITDIAIDPTDANVLVLNQQDFLDGTLSGVYRSTNALSGLSATFTRVINYAGTFNNAKLASYKPGAASAVFYLASEEGANEGSVRRSTDGGATWTAPGALGGTGFCSPQCFYDIAVDVDPGATAATTDDIVYLGGAAGNTILQKSTNGGASFVPSQRGLHADTHAIEIAPSNPNVVYTGDDGGIFRSYNKAADWNSLNNTGFNALQFQSLALHPTDRYFTIGGTQDNGTEFLQPDGNTQLPYNSWRRADFGDGGFAQIDQSATSTSVVTMYHTYFNATGAVLGFARVSNTACATEGQWAFKGFGAAPGFVNACGDVEGPNGITPTDRVLFYAPLELGPGTPNTVYYGTDRLYRSNDRGDTMTLASQAPVSPLAGNPTVGDRISAIAISPQNDNVRMVGLEQGGIFFTTSGLPALTSLDPVGAGSLIPDKYVARIRFDPTNANTAYIALNGFTGAQNHVYRVTNLNTVPVITNISGTGANGIPDVPVNAFAVDPQNPSNLYAGTDIGVYVSTNGGTTWSPYGTNLPRVAIFDMEIQNQHRILRVATHGKGMWEIGLVPGATLSISGTLRDASNNPVQGGLVRLNNGPSQVFTDATGTYTFSGLAVGGNYTVTVLSIMNTSLKFAPPYRTFNDMSTNQTADFVGTATPSGPVANSGTVLITEFRSEGPAGATDEFVELYNNTDAAITVQAADNSQGWSVYSVNATGTAVVEVAVIPNGTVIPARGHYLLAGSAYSLRSLTVSDLNYNADIPNNTGVTLLRTTSIAPVEPANRLDSIGFSGHTGEFSNIFREGSGLTGANTNGLQHSYVRRTLANGNPRDTEDNNADVVFVSTNAALGSLLGAPGPENVFSPITRTGRYGVGLVDPSKCSTCQPNYERVGADYGVNKAFGTLTLRRKFTNNTGQTARRLRFRVIDITTLNTPGGGADLRLVDSTDTVRGAFTIRGTQIELPMQPMGGGYNSSATVVLPDGGLTSTSGGTCPAGATCSFDVQFTLGVEVQGAFRFVVNIESLP